MSLAVRMKEMEPAFRDDFEAVLLEWLTRERRSTTGHGELELEVLGSPHRNSPFLTVAEGLGAGEDSLPWRVVKLLSVTEEDASEPFWRDVLAREHDRWLSELERRLESTDRIGTLGLPLSTPRDGPQSMVALAELGPLRRVDLLEGESAEATLRLPYLVRPYVAWPRLRDVGYSAEDLRRRWELYTEEHEVAEHLREPLFHHFCDEVLTDGRADLLWTTAWRLEGYK